MKGVVIIFVCGVLLVLLNGMAHSHEEHSKGWLYDEVLTQLHEMRAEIKAVNSTMVQLQAGLNKDVTHRGTAKVELINLNVEGSQSLGNNKATVAIVEFSDYQCPFCKKYHNNTYIELKKNYINTGKVKYSVMDFPLSFHNQAELAAVAARCAGNQGKFWEMQHALFDTKQPLGDKLYRDLATKFRLDLVGFDACMKDKGVVEMVNQQMEYGSQLGVQGAPAFFIGKLEGDKIINARLVSGAQTYQNFSRIVDALLKD